MRIAAGGHLAEVETTEALTVAANTALELWRATETPHLARGLTMGAVGYSAERDGPSLDPDEMVRRY